MIRATTWPPAALLLCVTFAAAALAQGGAPPKSAPPYPPGVDGTTRTTYYDVHGRTAAQVAADMRRQGPKGPDGQPRTAFADSRFQWRYVKRPVGLSCRATDVRVTIAVDAVMPRWVPGADSVPGVYAMWNQSMQALTMHEDGHGDIRVRFATAIRDRILSLQARCDRFAAEADSAGNAIVAEMRAAQAKYDADTRNGLSQGTAFPPRPTRDSVARRRPPPP